MLAIASLADLFVRESDDTEPSPGLTRMSYRGLIGGLRSADGGSLWSSVEWWHRGRNSFSLRADLALVRTKARPVRLRGSPQSRAVENLGCPRAL